MRLLIGTIIWAIGANALAQYSGTAFVVAPGLLVTNHHVIDDCGPIEVIAADGKRPATVVDSVEQIDLALLRVYGLRGGVASLRTGGAVKLGEPAIVFGFPLGGALSSTGNFTTGVVSSLRGVKDAAGEIQFTAPIQPGNSGGPVLDRAGSVIGVVSSRLSHNYTLKATGGLPQNVNFAVSLDVLADFLAKNSVSFQSVDLRATIETTQVAEMAQAFTYKISCISRSKAANPPARSAPVAPNQSNTQVDMGDPLTKATQIELNRLGYGAGIPDGLLGPTTQSAIRRAQQTLKLPTNGLPSVFLLKQLQGTK